jgi:hypothetical protein
MENDDTDVRVGTVLPKSLHEALIAKARASGMKVATYLRKLAIEATGWKDGGV